MSRRAHKIRSAASHSVLPSAPTLTIGSGGDYSTILAAWTAAAGGPIVARMISNDTVERVLPAADRSLDVHMDGHVAYLAVSGRGLILRDGSLLALDARDDSAVAMYDVTLPYLEIRGCRSFLMVGGAIIAEGDNYDTVWISQPTAFVPRSIEFRDMTITTPNRTDVGDHTDGIQVASADDFTMLRCTVTVPNATPFGVQAVFLKNDLGGTVGEFLIEDCTIWADPSGPCINTNANVTGPGIVRNLTSNKAPSLGGNVTLDGLTIATRP